MLPPAHRLRHTADVVRVRQCGRPWRHPLVTLIICPNPAVVPAGVEKTDDQSNKAIASRFGFVAGRQVGSAVRRNRVKRRLREIIRHRLDQIAGGLDFLVIARQPAAEATYAELENAVVQLLQRAGVLAFKQDALGQGGLGQEHSEKP